MKRLIALFLMLLAGAGMGAGCQGRAACKADVVAGANRYAESIKSWEVRYHAESVQMPTVLEGESIPAIHNAADVHEISQGANHFAEGTTRLWSEPPANPPLDQAQKAATATDGRMTYAVADDSGVLSRLKANEYRTVGPLSYRVFLLSATPRQAADMLQITDLHELVNDPTTTLLGEPMRINGRPCVVLERRTSFPLMGQMEGSTQPATKYGENVTVVRVALDAQRGYMPVRVTSDYEITIPEAPAPFNHQRQRGWEMVIEGMEQTASGAWLPTEASVTSFRDGDVVHTVHRLKATDIRLNTQHPAEQFVLSFPPGTRLFDAVRRIGYLVGDKQEIIDERLAERALKDATFDKLLGKPPPPLQGQRWLVGKPMTLAELKGRPVILHFWNIGCGSCVHEIPHLQRAYGTPNDYGPIFISIHSDGGTEMIPEIERFLKEHGVTFPVMLDAPDPEGMSWGLTNKAYGVYAVPTEAQIDAHGRVIMIKDRKLEE